MSYTSFPFVRECFCHLQAAGEPMLNWSVLTLAFNFQISLGLVIGSVLPQNEMAPALSSLIKFGSTVNHSCKPKTCGQVNRGLELFN